MHHKDEWGVARTLRSCLEEGIKLIYVKDTTYNIVGAIRKAQKIWDF